VREESEKLRQQEHEQIAEKRSKIWLAFSFSYNYINSERKRIKVFGSGLIS